MVEVVSRQILLQRFAIACEIGIHDFEVGQRQRVTIDITLDLAADLGHVAGEISSVVDYDFLRHEILALTAARPFPLQEDLAWEIARICLKPEAVLQATVQTGKPDVYPDCDSVSYRLVVRK